MFNSPSSFVGIDIGTSSLKVVELVSRRKRIEVATYAQANLPNILLTPPGSEEDALRRVASVLQRMLEKANVTSDVVVAALPSSVVFSTVINLPALPDEEMDKAIRFAARDVVPSDIDDTVLGWSRVGQTPHMDTDQAQSPATAAAEADKALSGSQETVPIFLTAASKNVVDRYVKLMEMMQLQLFALEVETFPLVRSLLSSPNASGLIVDIGDRATTFHVIDQGTPRFSSTVEFGGWNISQTIAKAANISVEEAEAQKIRHGLSAAAPGPIRQAAKGGVGQLTDKAKSLLDLYQSKTGRKITKSILIGGGANLRELKTEWSVALGNDTVVGNPWKGLSYPVALEARLLDVGPTYAVAVGLALRGLTTTAPA
jgi:type IV pilus assembly protein PilM